MDGPHGNLRARTIAIAAVLAALAPGASARAAELPAGFAERTLLSGLTRPTAVAWTPDGRMLVTEKDGALKVLAPGAPAPARIVPGPEPSFDRRVNAYSDRGLLGLAVDSAFAANGYVYLLYTYDRLPDAAGPGGDSPEPMVSQLLRLKLGPANQVLDQDVILGTYTAGACPPPSNTVDCIPADGWSHAIGTVRSAPDGTLYVGSGDAADYGGTDERAFRTYDERSMAGKIMRIDRNGRGLPGHAFCPGETNLDLVCTKLHAKGFRNPFRFELTPSGGLLVGDVGWNSREEIDIVDGPGKNYGWPCFEGSGPTPNYSAMPRCASPEPAEAPAYSYPHGDGATALGGPTYVDTQYPAGYRNTAFVGDLVGRWIRRLVPAPGGGAPSVVPFGSDFDVLVDMERSPAGNLAIVAMGDDYGNGSGSVREIVYSPGNRPPVARAAANPAAGSAPLEVRFSSSGSSDPDGDPLSYAWDFGDGTRSNAANPRHTYAARGSYTARLTVSDGRGLSASEAVGVDVDNTPPRPSITVPAGYRGGQPVPISGSADDDQDGPLPASAFAWEVRLDHNGDHQHPVTQPSGTRELSFPGTTDHDADSHYVVDLTVTDSDGATATATAEIRPETGQLSIDSVPAGAPVSYAGRDIGLPFGAPAAIGFEASVAAADRFSRAGRDYAFEGWSDGGARAHALTIPVGGASLTARYRDVTPVVTGLAVGPVLPHPDRAGPRLSLKRFDGLRGAVSGGARDPSGLRSVQVAVGRANRTRRCAWWLPSRRRLSAPTRSCAEPAWIKAKLSGRATAPSWRALLRRRNLPAGGYRVLFRAVDRNGNVTRALTSGVRTVKLKVARAR